MDAGHNNLDHEITGHASLFKTEQVCYKHACSSSGTVQNTSANGIPTYKLQMSVKEQSKSINNETSNEDLNLNNTRSINGFMNRPQINRRLSEMPPLACKGIGAKDALAGLVFMSNDKVRRAYFKYGVFGMPINRKPIVDRVKIGTKIFLFEFEARFLWGIFEATSEASLDIEKDAYSGSHVAFPAQVRFRVIKKCRPLPESHFQQAIKDNYFTPIKFNFELTAQQVSNLIQLYDLQDACNGKVGGTTSFAAQNKFPFEYESIDARVEVDSTEMDYKVPFSAAHHNGIPDKGRFLNKKEHGDLYLNLESSYISKTSDEILHCADSQSGLPAIRSLFNPQTVPSSPDAKPTEKNISNTKVELFQADDPICRISKAELLHYTRETPNESKRERMSDSVHVVGGSNTNMKLKSIWEGSVEDRYLQYESNARGSLEQLQPCTSKESDRNESLLQHPPCGYGDPFIIESCEYNTVHGNTNIITSPSVCVKGHTNDLRRRSKDESPLREQDNALPHYHLVYSRVSLPARNSRQSLDVNSSPPFTEIVQHDALPTATKESVDSRIKVYNLLPAYPVKESDDALKDSEVHAREALDSVPHTGYTCLLSTSANARESPMPDNEAWSKDHAKSFAIRSKASFHPYTLTEPDGEGWLQGRSHPSAMDHGDKSPAENSTSLTRRNEPVKSDGIRHTRKLKRAANDDVTDDHMIEDDEAWLERARNTVLNSLQRSLGNRSRLAASDPSTSNDDAKPRRSVWSRLSVPRKTSHPMQVTSPNQKSG
eukprot:c21102_g1_i2 orf=280-2592(+)